MAYVIGVDLGGTNTKIGILNDNGSILKSCIIKTLSERGMEDCITRIWEASKELCKSLDIDFKLLSGMGMGIPGPVEHEEVVGFFANFPWGKNINVKDVIEKITGLKKIKLDNDANLIALGEGKFGAGKGYNSSVTVTLGTGIGGGIYVNGKLISGFKGAGGEVGHIKLVKDGKQCGCGQLGCFEAYASAKSLIKEAVDRIQNDKSNLVYESVNGDISQIEAKTIFDAAKKGDRFALELVDYESEYLALGLANILNIINPEILILGGGVALSGDILLNAVDEKLKKYALPIVLDGLTIKISELGNDAGVIGAAALVI